MIELGGNDLNYAMIGGYVIAIGNGPCQHLTLMPHGKKAASKNANGRLRRWLPRHLDIDRTSDQDIQEGIQEGCRRQNRSVRRKNP
jgi:hypothetical protein